MSPVPLLLPSQLIALLEEAQRQNIQGTCALAFDADHTVWDADVGVLVFEALARAQKIREESAAALRTELQRFNLELPNGQNPNELGRTLHQAFLEGRYPDDLAYAMHAWAFAGFDEAEARHFADEVAREIGLAHKIRPELIDILSWANANNIKSYIVSASPVWMVRAGAALAGISESNVLAMTPSVFDGRIQSRIEGPLVYGEGKAIVLKRALDQEPGHMLLAAFGDSAWDAAMLRMAKYPIAVTPKPELLALSDTLPGLIEMAILRPGDS